MRQLCGVSRAEELLPEGSLFRGDAALSLLLLLRRDVELLFRVVDGPALVPACTWMEDLKKRSTLTERNTKVHILNERRMSMSKAVHANILAPSRNDGIVRKSSRKRRKQRDRSHHRTITRAKTAA
jgi:hypothetical protein